VKRLAEQRQDAKQLPVARYDVDFQAAVRAIVLPPYVTPLKRAEEVTTFRRKIIPLSAQPSHLGKTVERPVFHRLGAVIRLANAPGRLRTNDPSIFPQHPYCALRSVDDCPR
jgi:hypothetical protein